MPDNLAMMIESAIDRVIGNIPMENMDKALRLILDL
jgi:hypothetical protein